MPYILATEQKLKECCWMPDWALALPHFQLEALYKIIEDQPGNIIVDVGCFVGGFNQAKKCLNISIENLSRINLFC